MCIRDRAFAEVLAREEHTNEQGLLEAALTGRYLPGTVLRGDR